MKYGDDQELIVNYGHFEAWDVGIPGGNAFPAPANVRYASIVRNKLDGEYIFTNLTPLLKDLRLKAYTQNISRDVEMKPNVNSLVLPGSLNTTSGVKASSNLSFNKFNNLTVGVETWLRDSESARTKIKFQTDTIFVGEIPTPKAEMLDVGAFLLYNKVISPQYLNVNLGLRGDYIKTDNDTSFNRVFNYKIADAVKVPIPFQKNVVFDASTHQNFAYAAHIDINYTPVKRHIISLSLANAYRVASIEERFKYIDLGTGIHYGNPALQAENGFFSNLSYNLTLNKLLFKLDFFANYIFDMIAEEEINNNTDYQYNNIDEALFVGAEMDLDWLISRHLRFHSNASYVYTRNVLEQTALPMIPPAHGNVSLNYRINRILKTALSVRWAANQNQLAAGEVATNGYVVYDFDIQSAAIKIQKTNLYVFAGVDNILDTAYKNHLFNNRMGNDKLYEPGRNVFMKLRLAW
jgi:outer membrane receptor protein involved in Fe transport